MPELELSGAMIGNSFIDYLKIRTCIGVLRLIPVISVTYLGFCTIFPSYFIGPFALYAAAETTFFLIVYLPRRSRLQAPPDPLPPCLTREQRRRVFERSFAASLQDTTVDSPYPACWFLPKNSKPKRDDVVDWLLWALFSTSREQTADIHEHEEELNGYIEALETLAGEKFRDVHSQKEGVRSMRINQDPVAMLHRPLAWYFIVGIVDTYTTINLLLAGFKHYAPRESQWSRTFPPRFFFGLHSRSAPEGVAFPYWCRPHRSKGHLPLVFLHGIGIGLMPYIPFFKNIIKEDPNVGILIPEFMSLSMHMTPRSVPPRPLVLASLDIVLESFKEPDIGPRQPLLSDPENNAWNRVVLVGHSYGTFISGWILRQFIDIPEETTTSRNRPTDLTNKIAHVVLVNPIPILLSNPTVAHNFLYRHPSTVCPHKLGSIAMEAEVDIEPGTARVSSPISPGYYSSPAAWQLWYFACTDADVARTLFRTFFWTEGSIWREEIAMFLSARPPADLAITGNGIEGRRKRARNMAILLGGMDQIVPAEAVRQYLTKEKRWKEHWVGRVQHLATDGAVDIQQVQSNIIGDDDEPRNGTHHTKGGGYLEVLFNAKLDHAVIFDDEKWTVPLQNVVLRYMRDI